MFNNATRLLLLLTCLSACSEEPLDESIETRVNMVSENAGSRLDDEEKGARDYIEVLSTSCVRNGDSSLYIRNKNRDRAITVTVGFWINKPQRERWKEDEVHTFEPGQRRKMSVRRTFCQGWYRSLSIEGARFGT